MSDDNNVAASAESISNRVIPRSIVDVGTALVQLINLNDDGIFHEPTCIICSSPNRKEIEQKWAETKKHKEVKDLAKALGNIKISDDTIDNHMLFHYSAGVRERQQLEYIDRIRRVSSAELTTLDKISLASAALIERLQGVNSITPDQKVSRQEIEKIKSQETSRLMNSFNQLLKLQASIMGEMKSNGELITIPRERFVEVFNEVLFNSENDDQRKIVKTILSRLTDLSKIAQ